MNYIDRNKIAFTMFFVAALRYRSMRWHIMDAQIKMSKFIRN